MFRAMSPHSLTYFKPHKTGKSKLMYIFGKALDTITVLVTGIVKIDDFDVKHTSIHESFCLLMACVENNVRM